MLLSSCIIIYIVRYHVSQSPIVDSCQDPHLKDHLKEFPDPKTTVESPDLERLKELLTLKTTLKTFLFWETALKSPYQRQPNSKV